MATGEKTEPFDLQEQISKFEQENPKIAEAMALFDMSWNEYENALYAMNAPRTYLSDTTVPEGYLIHDPQD